MKALTIWQPWAGAVAAGIKKNETRSWSTKYRGQIAIHSAMKSIHLTWSNLYMSDEAREAIIRQVKSEVEDAKRNGQVTIDEWIDMLQKGI